MIRCPLCWDALERRSRAYTEEQVLYFHLQNDHKRTLDEVQELIRKEREESLGRRDA